MLIWIEFTILHFPGDKAVSKYTSPYLANLGLTWQISKMLGHQGVVGMMAKINNSWTVQDIKFRKRSMVYNFYFFYVNLTSEKKQLRMSLSVEFIFIFQGLWGENAGPYTTVSWNSYQTIQSSELNGATEHKEKVRCY